VVSIPSTGTTLLALVATKSTVFSVFKYSVLLRLLLLSFSVLSLVLFAWSYFVVSGAFVSADAVLLPVIRVE
jgi:hypothetical protein